VLKPGIGRVHADPNQIEQVILNLLVNARDAMQGGGKVTIATGEADLAEEYVATHEGAHAGRHVFFAISDTGIGMDTHTQAKIFEPFFTTKEPGKGTGLGLSIAYGIVRQHNGSISVQSMPNEGTTFTVYLPIVRGAVRDDIEAVSPARHDPLEGNETILIVEDDPHVRAICARVLERLGYTVIVAEDGTRALEQCGEYAESIDLLLTDIVMPGIDGFELAARVAELRPGIKTLFCSGYSGPALNRKTLVQQDAFLQKPYTPLVLAKTVRDVLGH
jgi:CheY-like chemotaxis protein